MSKGKIKVSNVFKFIRKKEFDVYYLFIHFTFKSLKIKLE